MVFLPSILISSLQLGTLGASWEHVFVGWDSHVDSVIYMSCSSCSCEGVEAEVVSSSFAQLMNLFSVSLCATFWHLNSCYLCPSIGSSFQLKCSFSPHLLMFVGWMNVVNIVNSSGMGWYEKCHQRWEVYLLEMSGRRKCTGYSEGSMWCEVYAWLPSIPWNMSFFLRPAMI